MTELRYTLLADGSFDRVLIPILTWLLRENGVSLPITSAFADFRRLVRPPRGLADRISKALDLYDCDLLFVHRDAETEPPQRRIDEIREAEAAARQVRALPPVVCVVPVRMTEAFLLFDERAIRRAAGNPNGQVQIQLPRLKHIEDMPDPKSTLYEVLRSASGLSGRRLKKYLVTEGAIRVANLIEDFGPLRALPAFQTLESEMRKCIQYHKYYHH